MYKMHILYIFYTDLKIFLRKKYSVCWNFICVIVLTPKDGKLVYTTAFMSEIKSDK